VEVRVACAARQLQLRFRRGGMKRCHDRDRLYG
jgi:hypothetical protein